MSFGRTPQQADQSYRNLTVTDTLAVRGKLTASVLDAVDMLVETLAVNGDVTVGGTLTALGGVATPSFTDAAGAGRITVPDATGTLVVADEDTDSLVIPVALSVGPVAPAVGTLNVTIGGVNYLLLVA